jgi:hypothetical protein
MTIPTRRFTSPRGTGAQPELELTGELGKVNAGNDDSEVVIENEEGDLKKWHIQ